MAMPVAKIQNDSEFFNRIITIGEHGRLTVNDGNILKEAVKEWIDPDNKIERLDNFIKKFKGVLETLKNQNILNSENITILVDECKNDLNKGETAPGQRMIERVNAMESDKKLSEAKKALKEATKAAEESLKEVKEAIRSYPKKRLLEEAIGKFSKLDEIANKINRENDSFDKSQLNNAMEFVRSGMEYIGRIQNGNLAKERIDTKVETLNDKMKEQPKKLTDEVTMDSESFIKMFKDSLDDEEKKQSKGSMDEVAISTKNFINIFQNVSESLDKILKKYDNFRRYKTPMGNIDALKEKIIEQMNIAEGQIKNISIKDKEVVEVLTAVDSKMAQINKIIDQQQAEASVKNIKLLAPVLSALSGIVYAYKRFKRVLFSVVAHKRVETARWIDDGVKERINGLQPEREKRKSDTLFYNSIINTDGKLIADKDVEVEGQRHIHGLETKLKEHFNLYSMSDEDVLGFVAGFKQAFASLDEEPFNSNQKLKKDIALILLRGCDFDIVSHGDEGALNGGLIKSRVSVIKELVKKNGPKSLQYIVDGKLISAILENSEDFQSVIRDLSEPLAKITSVTEKLSAVTENLKEIEAAVKRKDKDEANIATMKQSIIGLIKELKREVSVLKFVNLGGPVLDAAIQDVHTTLLSMISHRHATKGELFSDKELAGLWLARKAKRKSNMAFCDEIIQGDDTLIADGELLLAFMDHFDLYAGDKELRQLVDSFKSAFKILHDNGLKEKEIVSILVDGYDADVAHNTKTKEGKLENLGQRMVDRANLINDITQDEDADYKHRCLEDVVQGESVRKKIVNPNFDSKKDEIIKEEKNITAISKDLRKINLRLEGIKSDFHMLVGSESLATTITHMRAAKEEAQKIGKGKSFRMEEAIKAVHKSLLRMIGEKQYAKEELFSDKELTALWELKVNKKQSREDLYSEIAALKNDDAALSTKLLECFDLYKEKRENALLEFKTVLKILEDKLHSKEILSILVDGYDADYNNAKIKKDDLFTRMLWRAKAIKRVVNADKHDDVEWLQITINGKSIRDIIAGWSEAGISIMLNKANDIKSVAMKPEEVVLAAVEFKEKLENIQKNLQEVIKESTASAQLENIIVPISKAIQEMDNELYAQVISNKEIDEIREKIRSSMKTINKIAGAAGTLWKDSEYCKDIKRSLANLIKCYRPLEANFKKAESFKHPTKDVFSFWSQPKDRSPRKKDSIAKIEEGNGNTKRFIK